MDVTSAVSVVFRFTLVATRLNRDDVTRHRMTIAQVNGESAVKSLNILNESGLADVCKVLEISNSRNAKVRLNEADVHSMDIRSGGQNRSMTTINESGLYDVILDHSGPGRDQSVCPLRQSGPGRSWGRPQKVQAVTSNFVPSDEIYLP